MFCSIQRGQRRQRRWPLLLITLVSVAAALPAFGQVNFALERHVASAYVSGQTLDIEVTLTLETDEEPTVLGLEENLPTGWSFVAIVGGEGPDLAPNAGDSDLLDTFAWIPAPSFPVTFTYRVRAGESSEGDRLLSGEGVLRTRETGEHRTVNTVTTLTWAGTGPFHSADTNASGAIELPEALRVIQLYNLGAYHCAFATEDGYQAGAAGSQECTPHDADFDDGTWTLSLGEVLRVVQMLNSPGIAYCPDMGTDDGFCLTAG